MLKTHKIALDPNNSQRRWFAQQCDYVHFAYNHALSDFKSELPKDHFLSATELNSRFNVAKKGHAWTTDMDQVVVNKSIFGNLSSAIANWVGNVRSFRSSRSVARKIVSQQIINLWR